MADQDSNSIVADTDATPGSAEPVETTTDTAAPETPDSNTPFEGDPWAIDTDADDKPTETKTEEAEKPATDEKKDEKDDSEKPIEDQVLEELFGDDADKKDSSESKAEENLDKLDPKEMIAAQRNSTARAWAERNAKKAEVVKEFQHNTVPIADVATKLEEISKERYAEFSQHAAHKLVDTNPDATFARAYAIKMLQKNPSWDIATATIPTLDELIAGQGVVQTTPAVPDVQMSDLTAELDKVIDFDWRDEANDQYFLDDRELALAKSLRAMETKLQAESTTKAELEKQLQERPVTDEAATQRATIEAELTTTVNTFRSEVENKVMPWIAKKTGLEVSKDDTPEIAAFKQQRMTQYTGTEYEKANGIPSAFETFAYNESSVKPHLEELTERLIDSQLKQVQAQLAGNEAEAAKYKALAEEQKLPMFQWLAQANAEYYEKFIKPDMVLIGNLSNKLAAPIIEAAERVEVVSNGAGIGTSPKKQDDYESADDVWGSMVTDAQRDEQLRASA